MSTALTLNQIERERRLRRTLREVWPDRPDARKTDIPEGLWGSFGDNQLRELAQVFRSIHRAETRPRPVPRARSRAPRRARRAVHARRVERADDDVPPPAPSAIGGAS